MAAPWCQGPKLLLLCCSAKRDPDCILLTDSSIASRVPVPDKGNREQEGCHLHCSWKYHTRLILVLNSQFKMQRGLGNVVFLLEQLKNWGLKKKGTMDIGNANSPFPPLSKYECFSMSSLLDASINLCQIYSEFYQIPAVPLALWDFSYFMDL